MRRIAVRARELRRAIRLSANNKPDQRFTSLAAKRQGHLGSGKLQDHHDWVRHLIAENGDLTLDELCIELAGRGVSVHRSSVGRLLHRLGLSHKKKPSSQRTTTS